jgi:hypothetical protein
MDPDSLVKTEEEIIRGQCGGETGAQSTVTIRTSSINFNGLPSSLNNKSANLSTTAWSGDATYRKITRFYEIVEDFGNGTTRRGGASPDGNCDNGGCTTVVTHEAETLTCERDEILRLTCSELYNPGGSLVTNNGPQYSRDRLITGWADAVALIPNEPDQQSWSGGAMNCVWEEKQIVAIDCPVGHSGTQGSLTNIRKFTATSPVNGKWSQWSRLSAVEPNCSQGSNQDSEDSARSYKGPGGERYSRRDDAIAAGGTGNRLNEEPNRYNFNDNDAGGGSSAGSRVLCTYFTIERGWLPKKAYIGNLKYGQQNFSQNALNGYHTWGIPLVQYLRKNKNSLIEKAVFKILVEGWVYETAHRQGYHNKCSYRGKLILATLKPICSLIGRFVGQSDFSKLWADIDLI